MAGAAVFVARHQLLAGLVERRRERGDEARNQHHVRVGRADDEAVDDIGAGRAEGDGHVGRNDDALRLERILLRDEAHDDLAVGVERRCRGCSSTNSPDMCSVRGSMVSTRDGGIAAQCRPVNTIIATSSAMMSRRRSPSGARLRRRRRAESGAGVGIVGVHWTAPRGRYTKK